MKKILAISGSTRLKSINLALLKAIAGLSVTRLHMTFFSGLENLPQFNPDSDGENVTKEVDDFRQLLKDSEGVIICTPEYAHGVPGALKNAIDWTISSCSFPYKPTMLITASTGGHYGHKALLETLRAIEAKNIDNMQMVIPFAKSKISMENTITDGQTLDEVKTLIAKLIDTIDSKTLE